MHNDPMKILVVEDDLSIAEQISLALSAEHFVVEVSNTGGDAIKLERYFEPDLVILDLGLPDIDGTEVLAQLRAAKKTVPILVLTARADVDSKVSALDRGADDYLAKPFDMSELIARIRAITRRLGQAVSSVMEYGEVALDTAAHTLTVGGVIMDISPREFAILRDLLQNIGRVRTRASLEEAIYSWDKEVSSNAIEVHLSHLRKKLPKDFIKTIRGVGYTVNTQRG